MSHGTNEEQSKMKTQWHIITHTPINFNHIRRVDIFCATVSGIV